MQINPHRCIMDQITPGTLNPQEVADTIFKARYSRLDDFDDFYQPLDGLTAKERDYCLQHEAEITQRLDTTKPPSLANLIEDTNKLLAQRMKELNG